MCYSNSFIRWVDRDRTADYKRRFLKYGRQTVYLKMAFVLHIKMLKCKRLVSELNVEFGLGVERMSAYNGQKPILNFRIPLVWIGLWMPDLGMNPYQIRFKFFRLKYHFGRVVGTWVLIRGKKRKGKEKI